MKIIKAQNKKLIHNKKNVLEETFKLFELVTKIIITKDADPVLVKQLHDAGISPEDNRIFYLNKTLENSN